MNSAAVDLHVLGASSLSAVLSRAKSGLADWAHDWLRHPELIDSMRVRANAIADDPRPCFDRIDGPWGALWIRRLASDCSTLDGTVLGAEMLDAHGKPADEWLASGAREARMARDDALARVLVGGSERTKEQRLPTSLQDFGCGAIELVCDSIGLLAVVDCGALRHVPPREVPPSLRAAPTPLAQVLPEASLVLSVTLGQVELEVGKLLGLHEGDVLRLPTRLDHDLVVECEGQPFAHGLLGVKQGRRAIQIV